MNQVQPARKLRKSCKLVSDIFFFFEGFKYTLFLQTCYILMGT